MDRYLPGLEPAYWRIDVTRTPDQSHAVRVYVAQGPGFVSAADSEVYEDLTAYEVLDVVSAVAATLSGASAAAE